MDDLDYWRLCDELNIVQAAFLTVGVDPSSGYATECDGLKPHERPAGFDAAITAISSALRNGGIIGSLVQIKERDSNRDISGFIEGSINLDKSWVDVESLRKWLALRGMITGFFFPLRLETTDYLDKSHSRFSPKLAGAVRAWQAMDDENLRRGKSVMAAMTDWLEANYKSLLLVHKRASTTHGYAAGDMNKTAIAEAAKISNWDVDGGATRTQLV